MEESNIKEVKEIKLIEQRYKVSKSNVLIDSVYNLGSMEQKVLLSMISLLSPKDKGFSTYRVPLTALRTILNNNSKDFNRQMRELSLNILSKPFQYKDPNSNRLLQAPWFASCEYIDGILEVEFSPKVRKLLLGLKDNFTTYMLGYAVKLKSKYSIRLYEILKKNEDLKVITFNIDELKKLLSITTQYKQYNHLKTKVLEVSKKEINQHTDIRFTYKEVKEGRKVTSIRISIKINDKNIEPNKTDLDLFGKSDQTYKLEKLLIEYGITKNTIPNLIERFDYDYILNKIDQFKYEYSTDKEKINSIGQGAYLYQLISKDYINSKFELYKTNNEKEQIKKVKRDEEKRIKALKDEYNMYIESFTKSYQSLELKDKKYIDNLVESAMSKKNQSLMVGDLGEITMRSLRRQYISDMVKTDLLSYEDWLLER